MFCLGVLADLLAKGDVEVFAGPGRVLAPPITHLKVINTELARKIAGRLLERRLRGSSSAMMPP